MAPAQGSLFPVSNLPEGLLYEPEFLSREEETELLRIFSQLEFQAFDFHGYTAKRRVLEFGLEYDFTTREATPAQSFPEFLVAIRERAAAFAGLPVASLVEGMVSEYPPGAPIGWHRDAPQFGTIIGMRPSGSPCLGWRVLRRSYPVAAIIVGMERKKENSSAALRDMPVTCPAAMVDMEREVPGKTAEAIWQIPIQIA